jgi:hypothetical protein
MNIKFLALDPNKLQNEHNSLGELSLTHPQTTDTQKCKNMANLI